MRPRDFFRASGVQPAALWSPSPRSLPDGSPASCHFPSFVSEVQKEKPNCRMAAVGASDSLEVIEFRSLAHRQAPTQPRAQQQSQQQAAGVWTSDINLKLPLSLSYVKSNRQASHLACFEITRLREVAPHMFTPWPIGFVSSPFKESSDIPKGLGARPDAEGVITITPDFELGLTDIEGFSHLIVLWEFDRSQP